jgi:hypothetical protein
MSKKNPEPTGPPEAEKLATMNGSPLALNPDTVNEAPEASLCALLGSSKTIF